MRQAVFAGISALLMAVLLPLAVVEPPREPEPLMLVVEPAAKKSEPERMVRVRTALGVVQLPLEEYLTGVVLSEMPPSFHPEALKAQAVAARTFTEKQMEGGKHSDCDLCADSSCCQAWNSEAQMMAKLGDGWSACWDRAAAAVEATAGQVLTYGGSLIDAVYFSCSGGRTEDAVAVWGSEVPYLQSVVSMGEETAAAYASTVEVGFAEFRERLADRVTLPEDPAQWLGTAELSDGGGVLQLELGGVPVAGTTLRALFGLKSTNFTASVTKDGIRFEVLGYGHRVGMSQYGANAMAKRGSTWEEILLHYYTGAKVERWPRETAGNMPQAD